MKKTILVSLALMLCVTVSKAQTAMQFSGLDCNGNSVDLFADLDAGKAVVLFFYMPNCGACPPPAQKIQEMANDVNTEFPDFVKGYAFPYNNTTTCAASVDWTVTSSVDHFFTPMDSGATMVAYYGGFGMPTAVIVGGLDHRVLFFTMSFTTGDTAIMADSLRALYGQLNEINHLPSVVSSFEVFPNPASELVSIDLDLKETAALFIDVVDITGKQVTIIMNESQSGIVRRQYLTSALPSGNYLIRLQVNQKTITKKLNVNHDK